MSDREFLNVFNLNTLKNNNLNVIKRCNQYKKFICTSIKINSYPIMQQLSIQNAELFFIHLEFIEKDLII